MQMGETAYDRRMMRVCLRTYLLEAVARVYMRLYEHPALCLLFSSVQFLVRNTLHWRRTLTCYHV